jgi:hypothetical protein
MKTFPSKKTLSLLACLCFIIVAALVPAEYTLAQEIIGTGNKPGETVGTGNKGSWFTLKNPLCPDSTPDCMTVGKLVQKFVEVVSYLAIIFAVVLLIWTGLQFILARGAPDKIKEARNRLIAILIGVAIVIGARVIITVVVNTLEATGTVNDGTLRSARDAIKQR